MVAIRRLLIANRGEIARRVMRTAHRLGMHSVAVFAEPDAVAPYVREADQAIPLTGRAYLDSGQLIAAARRSGADAIHPGYGFLAESAEFAQACLEAGLVWVGPAPAAMRAAADKIAARQIAAAAGLPVLPGISISSAESFDAADAEKIGLPLLIKAAGGGGGRGVRRVNQLVECEPAISSAQREAAAAFGDPRVFAERLLEPARHIEVQVLGDQHGHLVHLFERDCSVQRRHQKLIEEAPAACLPAATRAQLSESALRLARAIDYTNAGTVEFLLAPDGNFYFLEMNARLQVEHPVTEAITGLDLVELQLRIAAGEPLPFGQSDLTCTGHAIEARLYAEDPAQDFLPSAGRLHRFQPGLMPGIRYENSVESGAIISPEYDALLSKLIAHAPSREEATQRLCRALEELQVHGVATNRDCLLAVLGSPAFQSATIFTSLLEQQPALCTPVPPSAIVDGHAVAAALALRHLRHRRARVLRFVPPDWRNLAGATVSVAFRSHTVRYVVQPDGELRVWVDDRQYTARVAAIDSDSDWVDLELDGRRARYAVHVAADHIYVNALELQSSFEALPRFPPPEAERDPLQAGSAAPLPGTVISVHVAPGDHVAAGQTLVVLEAMKIEHRILAETDGLVSAVHVSPGQRVDAHQVLVVLAQGS